MKKRKEGFLDFLYNLIDYVLVIVIFLIIAVIVTWKLDLLLNGNVPPASASIIDQSFGGYIDSKNKDNNDKPSNETETTPADENTPKEKDTDTPNTPSEPTAPSPTTPTAPQPTPAPTPNPTTPATGAEEKVFIPDGISAYKIGEILVEKGFITSAKEFNDRAVEMKLDRRMQTGYFMIPRGASLDQVIKIVCKVKN